jgi:hypothetical protein
VLLLPLTLEYFQSLIEGLNSHSVQTQEERKACTLTGYKLVRCVAGFSVARPYQDGEFRDSSPSSLAPGGSNSYSACSPLPVPGWETQIEDLHSTTTGAFRTEALVEAALQLVPEVTSVLLV